LRVKSGATSPTFKVFDSERLLFVIREILPKNQLCFIFTPEDVNRPI
jgi:hypothetical protein